jgi:hypothetical protein
MKKIFAFVALAGFLSLGISNSVFAGKTGDDKNKEGKKDEACAGKKKSCCSDKAKKASHCGMKKAEGSSSTEHGNTETKEAKSADKVQ